MNRTLRFLAARAVPGVESAVRADGQVEAYTSVLGAPHGAALVTVRSTGSTLLCTVELVDHRDLVAVVARVRRLLDLDCRPGGRRRRRWLPTPDWPRSSAQTRDCARPGPSTASSWRCGRVVGQQISVAGAAHRLGADRGGPRRRR